MNDSQIEEWREIPSGKTFYEASTLGRIRSVDRITTKRNRWGQERPYTVRGRVLTPWFDNSGYFVVYLCGDGRREAINVHRLICETFCEKPNGKEFVNHRDCNKSNNHFLNLEWCTQSENMAHAVATKLMAETKKSVTAISKDGAVTLFFDSIAEAAIAMGNLKKRRNVWSALMGAIPSAYGFNWHFNAA